MTMETAREKPLNTHFMIKMSYCNSVQSTLILFKSTLISALRFFALFMGYGILVAIETKKKKKKDYDF